MLVTTNVQNVNFNFVFSRVFTVEILIENRDYWNRIQLKVQSIHGSARTELFNTLFPHLLMLRFLKWVTVSIAPLKRSSVAATASVKKKSCS